MPRDRRILAVLFGLPLVLVVAFLGFVLSQPSIPIYGSLPLETGTFDLAQMGTYRLGLQYVENPAPGASPYTIVERADWWSGFVTTVNGSNPQRVVGAWTASDPVMVIIAWDASWQRSTTVATVNYGCTGFPGTFCPTSLVVLATAGRVDVSIGAGNPLCTDPADALGPCVNLGTGMQGMYLDEAFAPPRPPGTASVSVTFLSFAAATVDVVEPFAVQPA